MPLSDFFKKNKKAIPQTQGKEVAEARLQLKEAERQGQKEPVKDASGVIMVPYTSEKGSQSQQKGEYVFKVFSSATKLTVKSAVSKMYGVNAQKVRIINVKPRKVRVGKFQGLKPGFKKAIVTLLKGQKIDSLSA